MKPLLPLLLIACCIKLSAQDIYTSVLAQIEQNNPELKVYNSRLRATMAENSTGLAPENPEVEVGYLWGEPLIGNRKDLSIKQNFDFPSVYAKRNKLSKQKNQSASTLFNYQRQQILLKAKEIVIDLIYQNAIHQLAELQLSQVRQVKESYSKLMEIGETTIIDFNKISLTLGGMENELLSVEIEQQRLLDELKILNGGNSITISDCDFPIISIPTNFEQWYTTAEKLNPELHYLQSEIEVSRGNESLAKAQGLPKLSIGYQGEFVHESTFQGVTFGVSIPLWENRNKVKQARREIIAATEALDDARLDSRGQMHSLFTQVISLNEMEKRYINIINEFSNDELLYMALNKGQITLTDYAIDMQYSYEIKRKLIETRRNQAIAFAQLNAYSL